jgi:hypothetical protein
VNETSVNSGRGTIELALCTTSPIPSKRRGGGGNLTKVLKNQNLEFVSMKQKRGNGGPIKNMYRTTGFALSVPIHVFGDFSTSASLSLGYH